MITVVNHSKRVTNSDVQLMTRACASQLWWHAAPAHGLAPKPVIYAVDEKSAPPGSQVIGIFDTPDQPSVLGWHTEDPNTGVVYGRVFAGVILDNGGGALSGQYSVSATLSHEVLETYGDAACNRWVDVDGTWAVALELGDPVENDSYSILVDGKPVAVSNFVTGAWFDPGAKCGFDYMGLCTRPFELRPGGYIIQMVDGKVSQKFGDQYAVWRGETKASPLARTARRLG